MVKRDKEYRHVIIVSLANDKDRSFYDVNIACASFSSANNEVAYM